jgi:hypothetical protein
LADDDPALGNGAEPGAQALTFPYSGNSWAGAGLGAHHSQCSDRVGAADPIGCGAAVRLELFEGPGGAGPEDPVDPPAVEAESAEPRLQLGDIVATQVRRRQEQQPITKVPTGLDERGPRLLVALSVAAQTTIGLKGPNRIFRGTTKSRRLGAGGWKPGCTEAALQIAYCLASLTGCQREVGRNSLSS